MTTHVFTRNLAGDITGMVALDDVEPPQPDEVCRHERAGYCPYCHECGEEQVAG